MLFKPELAEKALTGEKTQTRRLQQPGDEAVRDGRALEYVKRALYPGAER